MPDDPQNKLENELNLSKDFSLPTYEEWKACAEESLKGAPFEKKLVTKTYEGIDLQPIYTKKDLQDLSYLEQEPGECNYLRGATASGYIEQPWEICQEINTPIASQFNEALKHDLERGQTGITLLLDRATQKGSGGMAISTPEDLSAALAGIEVEKYPLHLIPGFSGLEILEILAAFMKQEGKDIGRIKGSIDTDPLGYLAVHGGLPVSIEDVFAKMARMVKWAVKNAPHLKTIGACGLPYHHAGADAVRELAYVSASAVEYIQQLLELDEELTIDDVARSMRFTFGIGSFYFMEIAKIRAARMLWARIIQAWGGSKNSQKMTIHARTSTYNQTRYDPYVNMLRTTTEAFSAIAAGVDSLQTNRFNEVLDSSDEFARRTARNIQIVLNEECRLNRLIDPGGGSYYIEKLTHEVAQKAWEHFREIEAKGGMLKALQQGFPQKEIETVAQKRKDDIARRKSIIVGTNFSANVGDPGGRAKAFDSEVSDSGSLIKIKPLKLHRASEIFEELRDAVDAYKEKTKSDSGPKLFLAVMGSLSQYKPRADFSQAFFEIGGFDVIYPPGFETPEEAAAAVIASGAGAAVVCSSDENYLEMVPSFTRALKEKNPEIIVVLAGNPDEREEMYKQAGVDEFIYIGIDAHLILSRILKKLGVLS